MSARRTQTLCARRPGEGRGAGLTRGFGAVALLCLLALDTLLEVADAFLDVALRLVELAADLSGPVADGLAGLFLDLALGLVPLAFCLVLHFDLLAGQVTRQDRCPLH